MTKIFEGKKIAKFACFYTIKVLGKKIEMSKFNKSMSGRAENLNIGLTFCALSSGTFSLQSEKFSATELAADLMDALLNFKTKVKV